MNVPPEKKVSYDYGKDVKKVGPEQKLLNEFVEWLKEETLPGVWSKGVQLSRAVNSIEFVAEEKGEWKFKIKTQERILAFSVTLWIADQDSHCNCGSKIEPCHHIVGVAIALQNGTVKFEKSSSQPHLEYQWKLDESQGKIELLRFVATDQNRVPLAQSLISYVSGVQSGRINGKLPATTSLDLKIDEILNRSNSSTPGSWRELLACVSELPPISGLSAKKGNPLPPLRIVDAEKPSDGVRILTEANGRPDAEFKNGVQRIGSVLSLKAPTPPFKVPSTVEPFQYEKFLNESLPLLHDYFEVVNESKFLPKLVDRDPYIEFKMVEMEDGKIALTPSISYGELAKGEIAVKDRSQEQELMRDLRQNKQMGVGQTVMLTPYELFQRRNLSPEVQKFTTQYFSGLMSELHVDYAKVDLEKQEQTILHLLSMREKGEFSPQATVLAKSLNAPLAAAPSTPEKIPTTVPKSLWSQLRDYQKQGVYWLSEQNTAGAILADDMGLGKTVQTLAIAQSPALIVAPTSLLHNWKEEAKRFRPDFKVNLYHGANREWDSTADLTITSYGILRADQEKIAAAGEDRAWKTMVLDEAHLIRNQETLAAQAAFRIPAAMKIALTGTPVQNKRSDLFSLFQFISPGLFANEGEMKPELVAPFVLRRKKEDVLKELPPKTHLLHEIEMREAERERYQSVWAAAKAEIIAQINGVDGAKVSPLSMFEALLRARQACDHSGLFLESDWKRTSSKLQYIVQMLEDLTEAGHSVLVYSQWTKFLDRIEEEVSPRFAYERLDGSTTNRSKVVESFQKSTDAKVFLLSLHAGGVGLNLTKASHVIFCDPWWNPFVELQAEDRAYRMGQEKPVTIHRLICAETVEEKLLKIQDAKKKIGIDALGSANDSSQNIAFTESDLLTLISE